MQVKEESVFVPKKITMTIESEEELALLFLRLNCPISFIIKGNGGVSEFGQEENRKITTVDEKIKPLFRLLFDSILTDFGEKTKWAFDVIWKMKWKKVNHA